MFFLSYGFATSLLSASAGLCDGHDDALTGASLPDADAQSYFSILLDNSGLKTAAFPFASPDSVLLERRGYICELDGNKKEEE